MLTFLRCLVLLSHSLSNNIPRHINCYDYRTHSHTVRRRRHLNGRTDFKKRLLYFWPSIDKNKKKIVFAKMGERVRKRSEFLFLCPLLLLHHDFLFFTISAAADFLSGMEWLQLLLLFLHSGKNAFINMSSHRHAKNAYSRKNYFTYKKSICFEAI